jgi:hypothetical protein
MQSRIDTRIGVDVKKLLIVSMLLAGALLLSGLPAQMQDGDAPTVVPTPDYGPVTVLCNGAEVDTLVTIAFGQSEVQQSLNTRVRYGFYIYGLEGLLPALVLRTGSADGQPAEGLITTNVCVENAADVLGDRFRLPDGTSGTVTEETLDAVAQLNVTSEGNYGVLTAAFVARGGSGGRYIAFVDGLTLDPANDTDLFRVRVGPRAALHQPLDVYVVAVGENNRLDPVLRVIEPTGAIGASCDDAGRRGCAGIPPVIDVGVVLNYGTRIVGDRFDAGLRLPPGWVTLEVASFGGNTRGDYALLFIGGIAPRP